MNTYIKKKGRPFINCKKIIIVFISFAFCSQMLKAQNQCYFDNNSTYPAVPAPCNSLIDYIPDANTPTLTYKLNFHFFRESGGTGVFQPAADAPKIAALMANLNAIYASFNSPLLTVPNTLFIQIPKIQFVLKGTHYHDDDAFYNFNTGCSYDACQTAMLNQYGLNTETELNVFFYIDPCNGGGCGPFYSHVNMMTQLYANAQNLFNGASAQLLAHELGHAIGGIFHTYSGCDVACTCYDDSYSDTFWPDCNTNWVGCSSSLVGGSTPCPGCQYPVSNNIMGYNTCRDYMSPKQLGDWHMHANNLLATKYLTFREYDVQNSFTINTNQTWNRTYVIGGDLIVNANLTINCNLYMTGESKIKINPGGSLTVNGVTITNVFNEMWEGIEVENGGSIVLNANTKIEHAYRGVTLKSGCVFQIAEATFKDCYMGIFNPVTPGGALLFGFIYGTTFDFSGTFLPYNGAQPQPLTHPLAGMTLNNTNLNIGVVGKPKNVFNNLNIGIQATNSIITVRNSQFTNIKNYDGYSSSCGNAIVCDAAHNVSKLTVDGLGIGTLNNVTFDNCDQAVFTNRSSCTVTNCKMQNMGYGVQCKNAPFKGVIYVGSNIIQAQYQGITLQFNQNAKAVSVLSNNIDVGQLPLQIATNYGIDVEEYFSGANNSLRILDNVINITNGTSGIRVLNSNNAVILFNTVQFNHNTYGAEGVLLSNAANCFIECNTVTESNGFLANYVASFRIALTNNLHIECNSASKTRYGYAFFDICPSTHFAGNYSSENFYGVYINGNSIIDPQEHQGNIWQNYHSKKGKNVNTNFNASKFTTNPADGTDYNPLATEVEPNSGWFFQNSLGSGLDHCALQEECDAARIANDTLPNDTITNLDLAIAMDSISFTTYDPETREGAKLYLVDKINDNAVLLSNTVIAQFYNNIIADNFDEILTVQTQTIHFTLNDVVINAQLAYNDSLIEWLNDEIKSNDSLINLTIDDSIKNWLVVQNHGLYTIITQTADNSSTLLAMQQMQNVGEIDNIAQLNIAIVPNSLAQENEQIVNAIYLETFARGVDELTTQQYAALLAVAQQCPYAGGRAVYRARALLSMINRNIAYDDVAVCTPLGLNRTHQQIIELIKNNALHISPNPAYDFIHVNYNSVYNLTGFIINNIHGKIVLKGEISGYTMQQTIDITKLVNGMYDFAVYYEDGTTLHTKFIVQR